jgi:CBS domain-containing membrane protein
MSDQPPMTPDPEQEPQSHGTTDDLSEPANTEPVVPDSIPSSEVISAEIMDVETAPLRPPPRSLRLKSAQDATAQPLGVTATLPAPNWPPKVVADLMTRKIITVEEHEPIGNLEECMAHYRFRHLPVVTADMKLIGLISRTDLLHAQLGRKPDGTEAPKLDSSTPASLIMRKNLVVAQLDQPLVTVCHVMLKKQLTCVPVVLQDGTLVGILTQVDFVKLSQSLLGSPP